MCARIIAVVRDRSNGDPVSGEVVTFRNPGGSSLGTDTSGADGSAEYEANGNPAGPITWDVTVSGEQREAGARAQRQIGPFFEAELAKSFRGVVSNGYSEGDGDECQVVPGSGRQVTVGTGCIWVQGIPFHFYSDTNLATDANATGSTRLDRVVLRCDLDPASATYGMGVLTYLPGTASLPSINSDTEGDYDYLLADLSAANGYSSWTQGNITDQREAAAPLAIGTAVQAALDLKANLATPTFSGLVTVANRVKTTGTSPSIAAGTGAGSSPSGLTLVGTDMAGRITFTAGTSPADDATVVTVTFNVAKGSTDYAVLLTPSNQQTARDFTKVRANRGASSWTIDAHDPLSAGSDYAWFYQVTEYEP